MTTVLKTLASFFLYAIIAVFGQNVALTRALGISRLVKLVNDETDRLGFGLVLTAIQVISAPLAYFVNRAMTLTALRPLVCVMCAAVAFAVLYLVIDKLWKPANRAALLAALPEATFNCAVVGTMLTSFTQSFTMAQTLGFALGSGVGYLAAVQVVAEAQRKLQGRAVPAIFRGLPVTLVYIGILAMAIYGFTGHMLAI